ncbi:MAG: M50 family metallopeptidase [Acidobacteria bacterium]|nr:M50 family metallopeptidase [Acidobacteriota bacterium]
MKVITSIDLKVFMIKRLIIWLILLPLVPGMVLTFIKSVIWIFEDKSFFTPVIIGFAIGVIIDHKLIRWIPGVETFEHEFTHFIAAKMFFRKVTGFKVTAFEGGSVTHTGKFGGIVGDDFIGLAPYFMPTFLIAVVIVRPLFFGDGSLVYDGIIGFILGFHTWSSIREFFRNLIFYKFPSVATGKMTKSDIAKRGVLYSITFIIVFGLFLHTLLFYIICFGFKGIPTWGGDFWLESIQFFKSFFS